MGHLLVKIHLANILRIKKGFDFVDFMLKKVHILWKYTDRNTKLISKGLTSL